MKTQIIALNTAGNVIRTTPLLRRLGCELNWVTASDKVVLSLAWRRTPEAFYLDLSGWWGDGLFGSNADRRLRDHADDESHSVRTHVTTASSAYLPDDT